MKRNLLLLLGTLLPIVVNAYDAEIDGIYYNFSGDEATVTYQWYNSNTGRYISDYSDAIVVPVSVTYNDKEYTVTNIGISAFRECNGLTSITIPNSVTSIGEDAFSYCSGLNSITIPNSVTSISKSAFYYCSGLTTITIPNSVTSISKHAFYHCSSLTSINIPESVTGIGDGAFCGCSGLISVTIPNNVTSIGNYAFSGCSGLTSVTIPNNVTSIGWEAFYNCYDLTSLTIGNSVTNIGRHAFYSCNSLTSLKVEAGNATYDSRNDCSAIIETTTNILIVGCKNTIIPSSVTSIGESAFSGCSGLTSITIPNSVTSIGDMAFSGCSGLEKVIVPDMAAWFSISFGGYGSNPLHYAHHLYSDEKTEITDLIIPNGVTSIGEDAFSYCSGLTSVTIPNSVTSIGKFAFSYCSGLTSVTIPKSVTNIGNSAFSGCYFTSNLFINNSSLTSTNNWGATLCDEETSDGILIKDNIVVKCRNWATIVTIPNSVTSIGSSAFSGCSGLTSVSIPDGVTSIGDYAFCGCSGLNSFTIGSGVTSIGSSAFSGCTGLTVVHIKDLAAWCKISFNTTAEGDEGGAGRSWTTYYQEAQPLAYAQHLYLNGQEIKDLVIPDGITSINDFAFYGFTGLTSVTIPNSVTSIGSAAFDSCNSLTAVYITDLAAWCKIDFKRSVSYYEYDAYSIGDNESYTYWIGSNPLIFAHHLYLNGQEIKDLVIPDGVTSIGEVAFAKCSGLTSVTIPNSVTCIGNSAFSGCSGLISVTIGNNVTRIGYNTFYGCSSLTSVSIGSSVTHIGSSAFSGCSGLKDVYCYATEPPIAIYSDNPWDDFYRYYYSFDTTYIKEHTTLHVPASAIEQYRATEPWSCFKAIIPIENIKFADANVKSLCVANWDTNDDGELSEAEATTVTDLGGVFKGNKQISSFDELQYFTGLTSIGANAFRGCSSLTSIIIPNNVTSIGNDAFFNCTSLTTITIPNGVTSIGDYALSNCSSLIEVYCYAKNIPSTGDDVFEGSSIESATLLVPKVSLASYKTTAPWSGFGTIVPIEGYTKYIINDEISSLNVEEEETECTVEFTHEFNGEWETLYLPFAIDYDAIRDDFDLAEIDGIVQNDDNYDGIPDFTVLSIMGLRQHMTTPNKPYLIRAKNVGEQTITFDNITIYPTTVKSIDCSSTSTRYEFTGSYNTLDATALANRYIIQNGELVKDATSLAPCRWYMTATARDGAALNLPNKIRVMMVEDVIDGVSSLEETDEEQVYDLNGRKLNKPQKGINIIRYSDGTTRKVLVK